MLPLRLRLVEGHTSRRLDSAIDFAARRKARRLRHIRLVRCYGPPSRRTAERTTARVRRCDSIQPSRSDGRRVSSPQQEVEW